MLEAIAWIGSAFIIAAVGLSIAGAVGVLRFPDVYTRIHAASITDTGAASLMTLGMLLMAGLSPAAIKLCIVWLFIMLTSPAAAHALAGAAFGSGHRPILGDPRRPSEDET
ncbi:MAG: monovalent cation/H(+) antiporter subunit G [Alphaproteobacteria bacterium]|nr:monovalent cation/H(+) antiporter subunit G [Alphaproteobacteria bacterium]